MNKNFLIAALVACVCGTALSQNNNVQAPPVAKHKTAAVLCDHCGTVQSVQLEKRKGEGGAAGIIGGAVVGGLLGNQIGKGTGNKVATVGGAVAGGYAGNEVQKHVTSKKVWITKVRMRDGSVHSFEQEAKPAWAAGNTVRVHENKTLTRV
jgi:outer membrane lipoprotein SlyB